MPETFIYFANTKLGKFKIIASSQGILSIDFPGKQNPKVKEIIPKGVKKNCLAAEKWLVRYFKSSRQKLQLPKIDDQNWSSARKKMSSKLCKIKSGETSSYQELARACGIPKGSRAIGQLLGSNPLPIMIPCHRILKSTGELGGFSGGLAWKKELLRHERSLQ